MFIHDAPLASLLISPVIYSLFIPFVLLDIWIWCYQATCFPIYKIAKVKRSEYIVRDRGSLKYLNWIERVNCNYCAYANGMVAYSREILSRTEQYFCPIKHKNTNFSGSHIRYDNFLNFGDAPGYRKGLETLREKLK